MQILLAFIVLVTVKTGHFYELPVPGCIVVEYETHVECFAHSDGAITENPNQAQQICTSNGGRLAIIQHEKTWKLITEKLPRENNYAWLGFKLLPNSVEFTPNVDLNNMSAYWNPSTHLTSANWERNLCFYNDRDWNWDLCGSIIPKDYLCQYKITTKNCNITDIDTNVIVNGCFEGNIVSNNTTVKIECSPGYYLASSQFITCRNGFWDKPICVEGCPPPAPKNHATLTSSNTHFNVGDKNFYICEDNYYNWQDFSKTHLSLTCQNDSTWSNADAKCSSKLDYTMITINASEISENDIVLKCGLISTNITWVQNGREVVNNKAFNISSKGDLFVQSYANNINGLYICQTKIKKKYQIGSQAYNIFGRKQCKPKLEPSINPNRFSREGESTILNCPQDPNDHQVRWFKNDEEIRSTGNQYQKIILGWGLLLQGLTKRDEGIYKCQTTYRFRSNICKHNITYNLTVATSEATICGVKSKNRPHFYQPWFVILQHDDEVTPFCFGALLKNRWIITSAFCLSALRRRRQMTGFFARIGSRESRNKYPISLIEVHPDYNTRYSINDIGLIRLEGVEFNDDISPVCISSDDIGNVHTCENSANLTGLLTGWSTNKMNLTSKSECRASEAFGFAEDKFCIKHGITDSSVPESAIGDNGAPFVVLRSGKEYLLGIFTGAENEYDYFTSIFHHYDWIKQIIN